MGSTAGGAPQAAPVIWPAGRAAEAFGWDIAECLALVADRQGPHYLAHSTHGIRDFAVGTPDCWPAAAAAAAFENVGDLLNLCFHQLDQECAPLDTGPLVRLVVQGAAGTLFEFSKIPGQNFFGLAFGESTETSRLADRRLAGLTQASVQRIGGVSLDWGGFAERDSTGDLWLPYLAQTGKFPAPAGAAVTATANAVPGPVADLCLSALSASDLHLVGICRRDQLIWYADLFETDGLESFFQRITPELRRRGYQRVAHHVRLQFPRFQRVLELTGSTRVTRMVLDVARGAMYGLPLNGEDYLVGVTLIQSMVDRTDRKLQRLQSGVRSSWPASGVPQAS